MRERISLEQERTTMDKMSSVGVLAGGIAHDFNNLLTGIYGNITLAETFIDQPERATTLLRQSADSIQRAKNLTNQLLTFATGSDPVREAVDTRELVTDAVQFALSGSGIAVKYDIEPGVGAVEVDEGQMHQAISNIVLNAKQALEDQGLINIVVRDYHGDNRKFVELIITDNGPGIGATDLSKIFDPYFTTKEKGTGLGLATTHSIVTKHGGSISVDSVVGSGTRFTLLLPAAKAVVETKAQDSEDETDTATGFDILVMDDEELVLSTIQQLLETLGHKVTPTRDGTEAISAYQKQMREDRKFDLVIVDLTVAGGMGGKEAAQRILELDGDASLIVMSGYSAGSEMARYKELGFKARLEKPFKVGQLRQALNEVSNSL